jgi:GDP-L-fucose synthase
VAGHTGLVGSAIERTLKRNGYSNIITMEHSALDLSNQAATEDFFRHTNIEYVFDAAALVGGIKANTDAPSDFFYINMMISNNLMMSAYKNGVKKLLFLGSACMYPKECPQPMKEEYMLTGLPEITNEGYALAKICGSRLCGYMNQQYGTNFISAIPANAYGINDCFDPQKSHVIPALIMKYHNAKLSKAPSITLWGTGKALREFIYTEDIAEACIFLMNDYSISEPVNIGVGNEISVYELSQLIGNVVGYKGDIVCDTTKPDGMMRRMVDSTRINKLGWKAKVNLEDGLRMVYNWYLKSI